MSIFKRKRHTGIQYSGINPKGYHPSQLKFYIILLPLAVFMLLPMAFIFSHAFKPPDELFAYPPRFFVINPTFKNFIDLFSKMSSSGVPVSRYLFNSIVVTGVTIVASILVSSTAAYALYEKALQTQEGIVCHQHRGTDVCPHRGHHPALSDHPKVGVDGHLLGACAAGAGDAGGLS